MLPVTRLVPCVVALAGALLAVAGPARAQDLAVALQCWEGASEGPVRSRLAFDEVAKPHGCKVLVSNNTGADLTGVAFDLTFGAHPAAPLLLNADFGNRDTAAVFNCPTAPPTGSTFTPSMVLNVNTVFPGFPAGTSQSGRSDPYGKRCFDYGAAPTAHWSIDVAAGATATLRVEFRSGFLLSGASFTTQLQLAVSNLPGNLTVPLQTVPVDVAIPNRPLEVGVISAPQQSRSIALAGTLWVGTGIVSVRGAQTSMRGDFYLPYLRPAAGGGLELAVDGGYDAGAGHLLLYDPEDLELNAGYAEFLDYHAARFRDAATAEDTIIIGGEALPLEFVSVDHLHIDLGHLSGNAGDLGTRRLVVSWAADFNPDPDVQAWLTGRGTVVTGRLCGVSDQSDTVCANVDAPLFSESQLLTQLFADFDHTSFNSTAEFEFSAATPFTLLDTYLQSSLVPWRDAHITLVSQVPVNSQGQKGEVVNVRKSRGLLWPRPYLGYYSVAASDGGHESNLLDRTVPSSTASDWVSLGTITGLEVAAPAATTEVRSECDVSRYGVRNFGSRLECDPIVHWRVPRNARPSINQSTYDGFDMTRASLGSTARITVTDDLGAVRIDAKKAFYIEVDGGSRYSVSLIQDMVQRVDYHQQRWPLTTYDVTTNQYAAVGCVFANLGLDNVRGPLVLTLEWPVGWEPIASGVDLASAVHATYGSATLAAQNQNWGDAFGSLVPSDRILGVDVDPDLRRVVVTFDGPRPDGSFPGQDQVAAPIGYEDARWVGVRIDGQHVPGVARFPLWTCKATLGESLAPDGAILVDAERALAPDAPFRVLGAPAPVLSGFPTPREVPSHTSWTTTIDLRNAAYDASGARLLDGAALSARDSVVYLRVPRNGDVSPALQGGPLSVTFTSASSEDARPIWVSTAETSDPPNAAELPLAPDWVLCAPAGATCDATALAALSLTPAEVRWVGFALGEVEVTDAAPRGIAPGPESTRLEQPYYAYVTMTDVASGNGVLARPLAYFASADTLLLTPEPDLFDVHIRTGCGACDDADMCTIDTCDEATNTCVNQHVACGTTPGIFAPVTDATGAVVGAIKCRYEAGALACDLGPDTDGDGRPNLVIYTDLGGACGE